MLLSGATTVEEEEAEEDDGASEGAFAGGRVAVVGAVSRSSYMGFLRYEIDEGGSVEFSPCV